MKYDMECFQNWLDQHANFEKKPDAKLFRLETTENLAQIFEHPELTYKTYHVAGSKGKGSVSKMLACVLAENERAQNNTNTTSIQNTTNPVGVYASPHVYDFRERVAAEKGFLPEKVYNQTVQEFITKIESTPNAKTCGSWFELNTAFSFLAFKNAGCKHAVFEVGMGGRLDATNVIQPEICLITRIELEHTEFLGDTLAKIAREKAGIIKDGTPVVIAEQQTEAVNEVFREVAKAKHAPIYFAKDLAAVKNLRYEKDKLCFTIEGKLFKRPLDIKLKMLAKIQATNALLVAVASKILNPEISEETIEQGLTNASLPGRFEIRDNIVMDGAHTVESIRETLATFDALRQNNPKNLLFALAEDKDAEHIVPLFKNKFAKIFVTKPGDFKKSDLASLQKIFAKHQIKAEFNADYQATIKQAISESKAHPLLITGSFYLLDEVNKLQKMA